MYFFQCSGLTTTDGRSLLQRGRKTFLIGLTVCARSIEKIADRLLTRAVNPFRFIWTYKMSQDHLELLFGCIRGKNGFNSNPDVRMFKSSLKRILLRNSIVSSKHSNCARFQDEGCGSIFSLKWNKRSSPLSEPAPVEEEVMIYKRFRSLLKLEILRELERKQFFKNKMAKIRFLN